MAKIINFVPRDSAKDADVVLKNSIGNYKSVLVIGWDKDEMLDARASLNLNASEVAWMIDIFKQSLLDGDYDDS